MYFEFIYENRRMEPDEIFLRKGKRENDGGVILTRTYYKHICKYHNVSPI
jgi:hypothetical protein